MNNLIFNTQIITGKTNSTIAKIQKLNNKKYRNIEKLFICDGIKLFLEAMKYGAQIRYVVLNNDTIFDDEIIDRLFFYQANGGNVLCVSENIFSRLTNEQSPQGIITVCEFFSNRHRYFTNAENSYMDESIILFESVRDPGNLGTVIRTAVALGIDRIILSSDCADIYSSKVMRCAMGAVFKINIDIVDNLSSVIKILKENGRRVIASDLNHNSLVLGRDRIAKKDAVIVGNEGHGISEEVKALCDDIVFIPIKENTESLNVAVASAILMWEIFR